MDNDIFYIKDTNTENNYLLKSLNNPDKLIIQTPTLFNINKLIKHDNYYELIVPLKGKKDKKIKEFVEYIEKLEQKIIYDAQINSSTWFNNMDNSPKVIDSIVYNQIIQNDPKALLFSNSPKVNDPFVKDELLIKNNVLNDPKALLFSNSPKVNDPFVKDELLIKNNVLNDPKALLLSTSPLVNSSIDPLDNKYISIKIRTKTIGTQILTPNTILTIESNPISYENANVYNKKDPLISRVSINDIPNNGTIKMFLELYSLYINQNTFELIIKPQIILFKEK